MSAVDIVPVEGEAFIEALRLTTFKTATHWYDYGTTSPLTDALKKGDVAWISLWARRITTRKESGEAQVEVALMQNVEGKEVRSLEREISVGQPWTQFTLPITVKMDSEVG